MKRLLDLFNDSSRKIWVLNNKYCPKQEMNEGGAIVVYTDKYVGEATPFSLDTIRDIDKFNYETFSLAYNKERNEILGHDASDSRMKCVWDYYYKIKKNDVILFVTGKIILGYYIVTGDKVKVLDNGEKIYHGWKGDTIHFENPLTISTRFGSPYLQTIDKIKEQVIDALKQNISIFPVDTNYKGHFIIPDGVTEIPEEAFKDCTGLTGISIPNSVTKIGMNAFWGTSLTNVIIPESISEIQYGAFACCFSLTNIEVSSNNTHYTSVEGVLFSKDKTILIQYPAGKKCETYVVPRESFSISKSAFYGSQFLNKLYVHENVVEIRQFAFENSENLKEIHILQENPNYVDISLQNESISNIILFVPIGSFFAYHKHTEFSKFKEIVTEKCNVYVTDQNTNHSFHDFVDLGLPSGTLWATCNIGASKPEEYGDYFAWGEIKPKAVYDECSYKWSKFKSSRYDTDFNYCKKTLLSEDDAATINWGEDWRMPTVEEQTELAKQCKWTWGELNGVCGYKVEARNGKWIFLPATGFRNGNSLNNEGICGCFWTSSLYEFELIDEENNIEKSEDAHFLYFEKNEFENSLSYWGNGNCIRPVMDQGKAIINYLQKKGFSKKRIEIVMYFYRIGKLTFGKIKDYVEEAEDRIITSNEKTTNLSNNKTTKEHKIETSLKSLTNEKNNITSHELVNSDISNQHIKDETNILIEYLKGKEFSEEVIERTLNLYYSGTLNFREIKSYVDGLGERLLRKNAKSKKIDNNIKHHLTIEQKNIVSNLFEDIKRILTNENEIKSNLENGSMTFNQFIEMISSIVKNVTERD